MVSVLHYQMVVGTSMRKAKTARTRVLVQRAPSGLPSQAPLMSAGQQHLNVLPTQLGDDRGVHSLISQVHRTGTHKCEALRQHAMRSGQARQKRTLGQEGGSHACNGCLKSKEARERARAVDLEAAVRDDADAGARQRLLKPRLADAALQPDHLCAQRSA